MDNFVLVSEIQYRNFLQWYDLSFDGYYYEAVTPSDRTLVYDNKEDKNLIAYREYGGEPVEYFVSNSYWKYYIKVDMKTPEMISYIGVSVEDYDKFNTWYHSVVNFPNRVNTHWESRLYDDNKNLILFVLYSPAMSDTDFYYINEKYIETYKASTGDNITGISIENRKDSTT